MVRMIELWKDCGLQRCLLTHLNEMSQRAVPIQKEVSKEMGLMTEPLSVDTSECKC